MLRAIGDAIFAVDLAGTITYVNPAAEAIGAAVGKPLRDVIDAPWQRAIETNTTITRPETVVHDRIFAESTSPLVEDGAVIGAVIIARDVSDHRVALRKAELHERFKATGALAAALAHQINNPLAVVMVHAELLRDELSRIRDRYPDDASRITEMIDAQLELERAVQSIARITADLRSFSTSMPTSQEADLRRAIEWAARSASPKLRDRARAITKIEVDGPVAIAEPRLGTVLVNLIANAAYAIAPGAAERNEIAITARPAAKRGDVVIEVRDTGVGIAPERLEHIFEPTFTTHPEHTGIGLGLAMCREIVAAAHGTIELESAVGRGTTARVTLPLSRPDLNAVSEPRARVLVVDSDDTYVRSIQRELRDHEVTCCTSAGDALTEIGRGATFDLILADVELSGTELYQALLVDHPGTARRVVFVAPPAAAPPINEFLAATPNRWFEKPIPLTELRALVQSFAPRV